MTFVSSEDLKKMAENAFASTEKKSVKVDNTRYLVQCMSHEIKVWDPEEEDDDSEHVDAVGPLLPTEVIDGLENLQQYLYSSKRVAPSNAEVEWFEPDYETDGDMFEITYLTLLDNTPVSDEMYDYVTSHKKTLFHTIVIKVSRLELAPLTKEDLFEL